MLHPLQVQCVTYIIQRGESMAGLFYMFILYAMQRADEAARRRVPRNQDEIDFSDPDAVGTSRLLDISGRAVGWYTLAVLSLILGFGSKEIMATAPGAVILFDRIFLAGSIRDMIRRRWAFYLVFLLVWAGFTVWHVVRASGAQGGIGFGVKTVTPEPYALTQSGVVLYYLRLCVWPHGLAIDYQGWPFVKTFGEAMPEVAITLGLLVITTVLLFWRPAIGFVCTWFFLILLPTSSFLPIVDAVFEHRLYLSLASIAVLVVCFGDWMLRLVRLGWLRPGVLAARWSDSRSADVLAQRGIPLAGRGLAIGPEPDARQRACACKSFPGVDRRRPQRGGVSDSGSGAGDLAARCRFAPEPGDGLRAAL